MTLQELFADPQNWTKRSYARDQTKKKCLSHSQEAVSWCVLGGIRKCYVDPAEHIEVIGRILKLLKGRYLFITEWNDDPATTIQEVQAVLKEANV